MGGRVSKDLTEMVTHLVVGEVGSKKYHVSFILNILCDEVISVDENVQYSVKS